MQVEILTPEHRIYSGEAKAVQLPGKEGLFQVLDGHAPLISTLTEGELTLDLGASAKHLGDLHPSFKSDAADDKRLRLKIQGGVAEVQGAKLIVLAD